MQIVIDIPEEEYKKAKWKANGVRGLTEIESIIANGIPLPKGHGRLIDANAIALIDEDFVSQSDYVVAECVVENAPTVLEAEGENAGD